MDENILEGGEDYSIRTKREERSFILDFIRDLE